MKTYITKSVCIAKKIDSRGVRWDMGVVRKDTTFKSVGGNRFGYINFNATSWWVPYKNCEEIETPPTPPLNLPTQYTYARVRGIADRGEAMKNYPDAIPVRDSPTSKSKLGHGIPVTTKLWNRLKATNDEKAWRWLKTSQAMWINLPGDKPREIDIEHEKVNAESIISGGNLVALERRQNKRWKVVTLPYTYNFDLLTTQDDFNEKPYLSWVPRSIDKYGRIYRVAGGVIAYIPLVSYTEWWIDEGQLQIFPEPPKTWTVEDVFSPDAIREEL